MIAFDANRMWNWRTVIVVILACCSLPCLSMAGSEKIPFTDIRRQIFDSTVWANSPPIHIIVGDRGKIYRQAIADDDLWAPIDSGTKETLFSVYFVDKKNGWVCGASGTILKSRDGGMTWNTQNSHTDHHLFSIHFSDADNGCAVGDWGTILVTHDSGHTWLDKSPPDDIVLYGVQMFNPQEGLIIGEFGTILRTSDGGGTWETTPSPADQSLFCVSAWDRRVIAAGLDGIVLLSNDLGHTWQKAHNPLRQSIYGISMKGDCAWAVGSPGVLLRSYDGGRSWSIASTAGKPSMKWDRNGLSLLTGSELHGEPSDGRAAGDTCLMGTSND